MSVQKEIFPGMILGIFGLILFTTFITANAPKRAAGEPSAITVSSIVGNLAPQPVSAAADTSTTSCSISAMYPPSIQQWCDLIERYAAESGLDPNLISAVMLQESAGKSDAYSKSGAVGLLQVMPRDGLAASFMCINGPCFADRPSMAELYDPETNVSYGANMLSGLNRRYGNIRDALKAYGPKDVGYYYADIVLGIFNSHK